MPYSATPSYSYFSIWSIQKLNLDYKPGYIIGEVTLIDCIKVTEEFENSLIAKNELVYGASKGRGGYAWKLEDVKIYKNPIEASGMLGLWNFENND